MGDLTGNLGQGADCLIQIYGPSLGRKYDLFEPLVTIGRDPGNTIVLESDSVSRGHASIELTDSGRVLKDLDSTNGTYLNDIQIKSAVLGRNDIVKIGDTIFKYITGGNIEALYHEEIYRMTILDGLTQVSNKRYLLDYLDKEFARCRRYDRNLSVLLFDIDHFKQINDRYGHLTGDYVLKELADVLRNRIRKEELLARYGGEEFVVILPESTKQVAVDFAEIIRRKVEGHTFEFEGQKMRITISVGVASMSQDTRNISELLKLADMAMYKAKKAGRNKVETN